MECSWNDGGKTQYYVVILDQLQGHSRGLVRAPELCVRGPLTVLGRVQLSYDGKYPFNNIISFIFYIITNFLLLNSCCLLL